MINYALENELKANLSAGEKLIWTGYPKGGIVFRTWDVFFVPFSLLWGGFAIFWETTVFTTGAPFFFKLWGIPFVLVGLYMIAGRFFVDAKKRENTIYGITQDRIIILSGIFRRDFKSLNIKTMSDISFTQKDDGSGTITFGPSDFRYGAMGGTIWPGTTQVPMFELISDVKKVYDKIVELQVGVR